VLRSILDTEISPELVPAAGDAAADAGPHQSTEEQIGPYELQDFHLYYLSRYGFRPSKVAFLAHHAWGDRDRGPWPRTSPTQRRTSTTWRRSAAGSRSSSTASSISQFKRSAMPNGPKVGSGGSLSPRGDWRAPSDASSRAWLEELRENVPDAGDAEDAVGALVAQQLGEQDARVVLAAGRVVRQLGVEARRVLLDGERQEPFEPLAERRQQRRALAAVEGHQPQHGAAGGGAGGHRRRAGGPAHPGSPAAAPAGRSRP
jgi:hypothetical protein